MVIFQEHSLPLARTIEDKSTNMAFIARKDLETIYVRSRQPIDFTSLWLESLCLAVRFGHSLVRKESIWNHEFRTNILIRFDTSFGYDLKAKLPTASVAISEVRSARFETFCRHVAQSDAHMMINAIAVEQFRRDALGLEFLPPDNEGNLREFGVLNRPEYPRPEVVELMRDNILKEPLVGTVT